MDENILFGVEGSYYAAKIRSYLMCKGIPFREIQADRHAFEEHIIPRVGSAVVPVIITAEGETLQDTAEMIDFYEQRSPSPQLVPLAPRRRFAAYLLELFADEWIKMPALHYRWAYDYDFAVAMMGRNNDPNLSQERQRHIGTKIAARFSNWPAHLGVSESNSKAVEAYYLEFLALLNLHFETHDFILGDSPTLGDCALMGPLYAHLYLDPYAGRIMREQAPQVCNWAERLRHAEPVSTSYIDDSDDLPKSLLPILSHLGREYAAVLATAMPLLQAWLGNNADGDMPLYVGKHKFTLGKGTPYEAESMRSIMTFEGWKVQRLMDLITSMPLDEQHIVEVFCADIEVDGLLLLNFPNRLERRNFKLVRAATIQ